MENHQYKGQLKQMYDAPTVISTAFGSIRACSFLKSCSLRLASGRLSVSKLRLICLPWTFTTAKYV